MKTLSAADPVPPPRSYQMELVWGCNLRCWFCGINKTPKGSEHWRFMDVALAREFARQVNTYTPKTRIEFGTGGESTLHPQFFDILRALREEAPMMQLMVQTNTEAWRTDAERWVPEFFAAGGNLLVLNCYVKGRYEELRGYLQSAEHKWVDFYYDNPRNLSMYHYRSARERLIFLSDDLGKMAVSGDLHGRSQRLLNNQGGATTEGAYRRAGKDLPTLPLAKTCNVPFLQLVLNWDGRVPLCCYDWEDRLILGEFPRQTLREIWEGRRFRIMRALLQRGDRTELPCATCDFHGGFRKGLTMYEPVGEPDSAELHSELAEMVSASQF